jgi:hypothetical protein
VSKVEVACEEAKRAKNKATINRLIFFIGKKV